MRPDLTWLSFNLSSRIYKIESLFITGQITYIILLIWLRNICHYNMDILPFGINGLFNYNPKGSVILTPGKVKLSIGKPIPYSSFKDLSVEELRKLTFDRIYTLNRQF